MVLKKTVYFQIDINMFVPSKLFPAYFPTLNPQPPTATARWTAGWAAAAPSPRGDTWSTAPWPNATPRRRSWDPRSDRGTPRGPGEHRPGRSLGSWEWGWWWWLQGVEMAVEMDVIIRGTHELMNL